MTPVDPLYRLAEGANHVPSCRYDVEKRAEQLRKDHHGVIDHRHGLYLLALPDVASKPTSGGAIRLGRPRSGPRQSAGIASDDRRTVVPMIAAAAAVVKLLHEFEHDPAVEALFGARWQRPDRASRTTLEVLPWSQFCWRADRVDDLALDVIKSPTQPRAVYGPIFGTGSANSAASWYIELTTGRRRPVVRLRTKTRELAEKANEQHYALGYSAEWGALGPEDKSTEVRMWFEDPRLVAMWR